MKPLLLLTGGTGTVGRLLLHALRNSYRLRLAADAAPQPGIADACDELLVGDLRGAAFARRCVEGSDVVIHLAANASPAASLEEAMGNVGMAANLFDAAAVSGVGRLVVASSVHASGLDYRDGVEGISPLAAARPCCPYGVGKVAVEALARLHQAASGGAVSCLRLGLVGWPLVERQYALTWLSSGDLVRLVAAALDRGPGFGIYNAVSADSATRWDLGNARADLGWVPQDRWQVAVDRLPEATACTCLMFGAPAGP